MTAKKATAASDILSDWDNIKEKTIQTTEALTDAASHLKNRAEEVFQESFETIKEKSGDLPKTILKYVKNNPGVSIGLAALAGVIFSQIIRK